MEQKETKVLCTRLTPDTYERMFSYCETAGLKLWRFIEEAVKDRLKRVAK